LLWLFNVVDDHIREMIDQLMDHSISGHQAARFLTKLLEIRGKPVQIICANGTEFSCKAILFWQQDSHVRLGLIQPGKPRTQRVY
jgi:putative transposase